MPGLHELPDERLRGFPFSAEGPARIQILINNQDSSISYFLDQRAFKFILSLHRKKRKQEQRQHNNLLLPQLRKIYTGGPSASYNVKACQERSKPGGFTAQPDGICQTQKTSMISGKKERKIYACRLAACIEGKSLPLAPTDRGHLYLHPGRKDPIRGYQD
eukprot:1161195-Pelagomonas_calceolata.AAC.3